MIPSSSKAPASLPVQLGEVIAGKYRVDSVLGQGAMGVVIAATHVVLQQKFAIKLMLGEGSRDPALIERFQREARVLAGIRSEHVTRVMDVGSLNDGAPYIVMEFLQGCDLSVELEHRGVLPLKEASDYLLQACEALVEAHSLGIVHRDLKPSNLFLNLRRDGSRQLKILDFGISKVGDGHRDSGLTGSQAMLGSPLYMAPEQIRDTKNVDARSDIWSLGVTLYEALAGKPPFQAEQIGGLLAAIMTEGYPSIRSLNPNLPREVEELIDRCLQKDRNKRLPSVVEFARKLKPFASTAGKVVADRVSRTSLHPVGQTTAVPPSSDPAPGQTGFGAAITKSSPARSALPWLGGLVILAAAALTAVWYLRSASESAHIQSQANQSVATATVTVHSAEASSVPSVESEPKPIPIEHLPIVAPIPSSPPQTEQPAPPVLTAPSTTIQPPAAAIPKSVPTRSKLAKPLTTAFFDRTPRPAKRASSSSDDSTERGYSQTQGMHSPPDPKPDSEPPPPPVPNVDPLEERK